MSCVLVPLDETAFAESILPDAELVAGPGGRLALVSVVGRRRQGGDESDEAGDVDRYLANEAQLLQGRGFQVVTKVLIGGDIPRAIDEGVTELDAEMVAVATHGMAHGGRLSRSSVAWKALAHSPVPILFRHTEAAQPQNSDASPSQPVTIMVPLDGSSMAEQALPVAVSLATRWKGKLILVQSDSNASGGKEYLDRMAQGLTVPVETAVEQGKAGEALASFARDHAVTHVVMTSHGRTGLSRVIAGDVAADLIERLSLPIVVVPSLVKQSQQSEKTVPAETKNDAAGVPTASSE
jgi:nucleotide-binding universal stress UspA family protein